ncbi:unnamed protein product [Cylindrotheca closterium]|uniref:DNA-directed RNA polymerase III subunit RPC4 n=1 Tax=Cylindrotheca closterium TaxID=2856 RepID=A0AAD2FC36_9STRA|nr:unnamed protein product [Cylindrotheca closterium]
MPPPPSQQGKFKPKKPKPKKKIKAGAATAAAATEAAAEPKATVSFAPSPYAGRGGRGRGRGGRGRGRMPMPTGKVYFTGGEKKKAPPSASRSSRSSSATRSATTTNNGGATATVASAAQAKKDSASTEEVVGQLEVAIGSSKGGAGSGSGGKDNILDSMDFEDQEGELFRPATAAQGNLSLEGFMYDTDSSEEEESRKKNKAKDFIMPPLELPLKDTYTQSSQIEEPKARQAVNYPEPVTSSTTEADGTTRPSPFVHSSAGESLSQKDDWFLVQLPTRLPPLRKKVDETVVAMDVDGEEEERKQVKPTVEPTSAYSEVVTHPVTPGGFDNALLSAAPGRIGKMVVYKSGRTVLVMEGADGSTLQFNVAEGLSCSFLQQPVAIDSAKNTYIELGQVKKSLVVSPILDHTYH